VNLIGEHTDYSDGLVMPMNTALYTWVTIRERPDRTLRVEARDLGETRSFELDESEASPTRSGFDYVRGVAIELLAEGVRVPGADLVIEGEIPMGGGLASSASLEVSVALALLGVAGEQLEPERIARLCQRAERLHAGVRCGIMDPFSIACGRAGSAMLLDCRSLAARYVELPSALELLVVHCGVKHRLSEGPLNERARDCARAVALLSPERPDVRALRDVDEALLQASRERLGERLHRRCRHVVGEIARVREAFAALGSADTAALTELFRSSHASLRDDFEVSSAELDALVEIADTVPGVLASRMVGAGFGGCVLVLCEAGRASQASSQIRARYGEVLGREPWCHRVRAASAAGEIA